MSVSLVRLRKRAAELEQKKQFDRALEVYIQILDEGGKDLDDEDVPLFNRVGDMLMRKGSVTEALGYYERAVDMYAERGYLNNAIALCSKILRQSPGRAAVYYKLARISAKKGFKSDARKNFLEYADRMQKLGMADEAFRALKEFASLYPDQDDVRLVLAELLSKENRKGEAIEQLQSLHAKLQSEGRAAEARATIDRMRAIDPSVTPREGAQTSTPAAGDLVFLDLNDAETPGTADVAQPASARAPLPTPVPALTGLSITFFPEEEDPRRPEGFESTSVESEPANTNPVARTLTPAGAELVVEPEAPSTPKEVEAVVSFDLVAATPHPLERVEHLVEELLPDSEHEAEALSRLNTPAPLSGFEFADLELDALTHEYEAPAHDLSLPGDLPMTDEFAVPHTPDEVGEVPTPDEMDAPEPDGAVAVLEPDETERAPAPAKHAVIDTPDDTTAVLISPASAAAGDDARAAAEEAADLLADIAAREAVQQGVAPLMPATGATPNEQETVAAVPEPIAVVPELIAAVPEPTAAVSEPVDVVEPGVPDTRGSPEIPDDFLAMPPSFGAPSGSEDDHAFPPLFGLDESTTGSQPSVLEDAAPVTVPRSPTPRATISIGSAESHLRGRLELDPENWDLRRQLGEALLDNGDRDGGLYELELAMVGFELRGDLDHAQEVADEIISVVPGSVSHHQKRVEYAVRSRDRGRLIHSYLELADALFRTGAADKAVAVYGRVLELDRNNERAELALATLAPGDLVKLRGVPVRPERWTDELVALGGDAVRAPDQSVTPVADVMPDEQALDERNGKEPQSEPPPQQPRVRFKSLELPVPDWDQGETEPLLADRPEPVQEAGTRDDALMEQRDLDADQFTAAVQERSISPSDGRAEDELPPANGSDEFILEPRSATPMAEPALRDPTPPSIPAQRDPTPRSIPTTPTPASIPSGRTPTPFATPLVRSQGPVSTADEASERPQGDVDSEFVDLGEWLRQTEPTRSTRMQVEDPKPTGDEQADFQEMLRRFKLGVAENVEAEDYEAHYDLGVAFKEMGLMDEAIAQFQKALRDPNQRVRSYEALGQCFVEKKQYPIAAALLQRATEVPGTDDQQLVGVLYLLGFATEHLGRPSEALPYYLRVFAVDIEFRDIADRVAALGNQTT